MKRLSSILMLAMVMVAALSFTSCGDDDSSNGSGGSGGSSGTATLNGLKGTWTTVSCSYIPAALNETSLANISFLIDYEGFYNFWSNRLGYSNIESMSDLEERIKILSYQPTQIKVQVPKYSNAELVMKKFGTLDDSDYKYKLCNGAWYVGGFSEPRGAGYRELAKDADLSKEVKRYGSDYYQPLLRFKNDGTGECASCLKTNQGDIISYYTFSWELRDKTITITKDGVKKQSKVNLRAIEGNVGMIFENSIW